MEDRRYVQRTRILRNAEIFLDRPAAKVPCTLQDLTSTGARLSVASTYGMPDSFELTLDKGRSSRLCRVMWRNSNTLGVTFEKLAE